VAVVFPPKPAKQTAAVPAVVSHRRPDLAKRHQRWGVSVGVSLPNTKGYGKQRAAAARARLAKVPA